MKAHKHLKEYSLLIFACFMLITSTAFVFLQTPQQDQKEQKEDKKVKPLDIPDSSKSDDLILQIESLRKKLDSETKKGDSINNLRKADLVDKQRSLSDLRAANIQYRKSLNRLKFILEKFPPDSVMKFYGEYKDRDSTEADDSKKKTETAVVVVPQKKPNLFRRIFKRNH